MISINNFIASFLLNVSVKNCENRSIFSKDMDKSIVSPFFDSRCMYCVQPMMVYSVILYAMSHKAIKTFHFVLDHNSHVS